MSTMKKTRALLLDTDKPCITLHVDLGIVESYCIYYSVQLRHVTSEIFTSFSLVCKLILEVLE